MSDNPLLAPLNPAQRDAVTTTEGPLLIIAGPGSGKTRVVTHRIAYLVEQGVAPWEICAITFTNKAANEMKARVARLLPGQRGFWISTFHSLCARILRREIEALGFYPHFTIYDEGDRTRALTQVIREMNLPPESWRPGRVGWGISEAKNRLLDAKAYADQAQGFVEETIAEIYQAYELLLRRNNALDFDDLLMKVVELFYREPEVLDAYQHKLRHVMVDEYQDTNVAQWEIARLLSQLHRNLCVVGDPDQSIYSWRGANPANLQAFEREFAGAREVLLDTNYRSTGAILAVADNLLEGARDRRIRGLTTPNAHGERPTLLMCQSDRGEVRAIVREIQRQMEDAGRGPADFAIFYRVNAMSRGFEQTLNMARLPYQIVGAIAFYERREVKDVLAYLATVVNPADSLSLRRIANVPRRGIGARTLERLTAWASERGVTLLEAVRSVDRIEGLQGRAKGAVKRLAALLDHIRDAAAGTPKIADVVETILRRSGYQEMLEASKDPTDKERLENLAELVRAAAEYDDDVEAPSPAGFLEEVALFRRSEDGGDEAKVQLMTLHAAKGLEFPVVFLAGCEDGLLPHANSVDDPFKVAEERRLMYVGITRAEQTLFLTQARWRDQFNRPSHSQPSRFLGEIDPSLLDVREAEEDAITSDEDYEDDEDIFAGVRVRHAYFGVGTVIEVDGRGRRRRARVRFPDGVRSIVLEYGGLVLARS